MNEQARTETPAKAAPKKKRRPSAEKLKRAAQPLTEKVNFTTEEAAEYLATVPAYLRELRMDGPRKNRMTSPPFVRLSSRKVIYRKADLDAWLEARLVVPTGRAQSGEGVAEVAA